MLSTVGRKTMYSTINEPASSNINHHLVSMVGDDREPGRGAFNQQHDHKVSPWSVIEDLDKFFKRVYKYHQKSGFFCMMLSETLGCIQFIYIVGLVTYLYCGIDYPLFFGDAGQKNSTAHVIRKVNLVDCFYPWNTFIGRIPIWLYFLLAIAVVILAFRLLKLTTHFWHVWEMKQFYNSELHIQDDQLDNITWYEVQTAVREVQKRLNISKSSPVLSDLDIYHHILRQENYIIALVNKRLLPPRIVLPILGEIVYWTRGLAYNMKLLLFYTSPFVPHWKTDASLLNQPTREIQTFRLKKQILQLALINLVLAPFIFLWQILYLAFSYTEIVKKEPGILAARRWSLYGRLFLRHFNELEHELEARLSRAHRPATRYMSAFSSPLNAIISRHVGFIVASICGVLIFFAFLDEDVLAVHPVLSIITVFGAIAGVCRCMVPDESIPWCPETLLTNVVAHTHYLPEGWKGQAHTTHIRKQFQELFQYTAVGLLEEALSPILTPFFLIWYVYPRAGKIVDFFSCFTVKVDSVGDICSFAQLDLRKHGNMAWVDGNVATKLAPVTYDNMLNDGKVEMSLIHFIHTNPTWKPPHEEEERFVENVMESSVLESRQAGDLLFNANLDSSHPYLSRLDTSALDVALSRFQLPTLHHFAASSITSPNAQVHLTGMRNNEGPNVSAARDMSISAVYMQDMHFRRITELVTDGDRNRNAKPEEAPAQEPDTSEKTPLLPN